MSGVIRDEVRDQILLDFPEHEKFLIYLLSGFSVTWGKKRIAYNTEVYEYFLKPEDHIKDLFGFEQEILMLYAPYKTMEPRTLQVAEKIITSEPANLRVEKYSYILLTEAENPQKWMDEYNISNSYPRIVVCINVNELVKNSIDGWFLRKKMAEQLHGRDLFDYRLPLQSDSDFFGRRDIFMDYYDAIRRSENRGIFGLRKTGKTSLIYKIKRQIEQDDVGFTFIYDGKSPSIRKLKWIDLVKKIGDEVAQKFGITTTISRLSNEQHILDEFQSIISKRTDKKVVVAFDEIEYLSPKAIKDIHWHNEYIDLWQFFWSVQSIYRNLVFIICGVNPYVVEIDTINGIQNPLFSLVSYKYLKGLTLDDIRTMIQTLGKRMGLKFEHDTYAYIFTKYGGHPLLTRLACSFINRSIDDKKLPRPQTITLSSLKRDEEIRDADLLFYCSHVVSELKQFYPDEYDLLEILATGQIHDFTELAAYPEYTKHLYEYGLLEKNEHGYPQFVIDSVKRYIGLECARREKRKTIYRLIPPIERVSWLNRRINSILKDIRQLEISIKKHNRPSLFGVNSFPEADRLTNVELCNNENDFVSFINTMNRCFVESIETYGKSIKNSEYFWTTIKKEYPSLWYSLNRVKSYRIMSLHLVVVNIESQKYIVEYQEIDLEGNHNGNVEDLYFRMQQATLDSLLAAIQMEINTLDA